MVAAAAPGPGSTAAAPGPGSTAAAPGPGSTAAGLTACLPARQAAARNRGDQAAARPRPRHGRSALLPIGEFGHRGRGSPPHIRAPAATDALADVTMSSLLPRTGCHRAVALALS